MQPSRWTKIISKEGNVRGVAIQATAITRELQAIHGLDAMSARGLGEATIAALLVASYCKNGERVNLNITGSKTFRQALVDAYPDGKVRGYIMRRDSHAGATGPGFGNEGPWGDGLLAVLRTKSQERQQPYIGTVPLVTGHLAKDLTFYWHQSEQVPSAVGLVVRTTTDPKTGEVRVSHAGGFMVQALPGASESELKAIESHIGELTSFADEVGEDGDPLHLLSRIFQSSTFMIIEQRNLALECQCSRERVERAILLTGREELEDMARGDGAEVKCDFCAERYVFGPDEIREFLKGHAGVKE